MILKRNPCESSLMEKYDIPVLAMSVESMRESDVLNVLTRSAYTSFQCLEVNVNLPSWVMVLKEQALAASNYQNAVKETVKDIKRLRDVDRVVQQFL